MFVIKLLALEIKAEESEPFIMVLLEEFLCFIKLQKIRHQREMIICTSFENLHVFLQRSIHLHSTLPIPLNTRIILWLPSSPNPATMQ